MLWCLLLAFLAVPANADNLGTIRADCRMLSKDSGNSRRRFSDATLNGFINEAQREVVMGLLPIQKSIQFELVAGTTYYSLPADFIHIRRLTRDLLVLKEESPASLDKRSEWQRVAGLPTIYFLSFASRTLVGFYPWPDNSSSTGTIRMDYSAQPAEMTADGDFPFNGIVEFYGYHHMLGHYCAYRASLIYGMNDMAAVYKKDFDDDFKRMGETATARPNYTPGISPGTAPR